MKTSHPPSATLASNRLRSLVSEIAAALLAGAVMTLLLASVAHASAASVSEGALTWGVKESWRSYVGAGTVSAGASINPDGTYTFPIISGEYDDETKTTTLQFGGAVHWQAYENYPVAGKWGLDAIFKDLSLEISPTAQILRGTNIGYTRDDPGGELHEQVDVVLAKLDIAGATATFDGGVTSWSAIPTSAGPGMGLYPEGTIIDPVSVNYVGPGGKPDLGERWDPPGGVALAEGPRWLSTKPLGSTANAGRQIYLSDDGKVAHVVELSEGGTTNAVLAFTALDAETLQPLGQPLEVNFTTKQGQYLKTAFDPRTESLFYVAGTSAAPVVWRARWDRAGLGYNQEAVGALRPNGLLESITWNPVKEELALITTLSAADGGSTYVKNELTIFRFSGDTWDKTTQAPLAMPETAPYGGGTATRSPFACASKFVDSKCLGVARDGSYIQTPGEGFATVDGENLPWPAIEIAFDSANELTTRVIDGTDLPPNDKGTRFGYNSTSEGSDGSLVLHRTLGLTTSFVRVDIVDGRAQVVEDPYTVAEHGNTSSTSTFAASMAADSDHGWEWVTDGNDPDSYVLDVIEGRHILSRFKYPEFVVQGYAKIAVSPDGSVYIPVKDEVTGRFGYQLMRYVGVRAALDRQPEDVDVSLGAGVESQAVSFTSTYEGGDPAPTRQWQVKAPGASSFSDVGGQTGETLSLQAKPGMSGSQYRAVYTSAAGKIASDVATLGVKYAPRLVSDVPNRSVTEGADATFLLAADANPEPEVTWQRRVGGFWQNIANDGDNFAINGPSLTVLDTNTDQSGALFRAKLTNEVTEDDGTPVYSRAGKLTVAPRASIPPDGIDLEHVSLEWTGNEEMQKAPPAGGSNYFSAGVSKGDEATYKAADGNAAVYQRSSSGSESLATWSTRAAHVSDGGEQLVRLYGGDAHIASDGSTTVQWDGSFSVNFYGGLVPFTFTDPKLTVDAGGTGTLTAETSGCASNIDNPSVCTPFPPVPDVTVADFSGVEIDPSGEIAIAPKYAGVEVDDVDPTKPQVRTGTGWGSWPASFVSFHVQTGLAAYWYTSGSAFDPDKAPSPFVVDFQGGAAPSAPPPGEEATETPPGRTQPSQESTATDEVASISAFKRTQKVSGKRAARLATLTCPDGAACEVRAPRRVRARIGKRRYPFVVLAPKRIGAGEKATLRLRLPRPTLQALGTHRRATTIKLRVRAGGQPYLIRVRLRGAGKGKAKIVRIGVQRLGNGGSSSPRDLESGPISAEPPLLQRPPTAVDVSNVRLTWYPRDSWLRYASSGVAARDGVHITGGATGANSTSSACPDRPSSSDAQLPYTVDFTPKASWYDPASGIAGIYGAGSVNFRWKAHTIDLTASEPEIEINGASSRAIFRFSGSEGTPYPNQRADLLSLDTAGKPTVSNGGKTLTYDLMRGTLTANGVNVFAGFYTPPDNDEFGCVSVSFTIP